MATNVKRCDECGSWGVQCYSDTPQEGCGCQRCAAATIRDLKLKMNNLAESVFAFNANSSFDNIDEWKRCVKLAKAVRDE